MRTKVKSIADELRDDLERCPDLRAQELIDLNEKGPEVEHIRWNCQASGRDLIDASMKALNDGYNWFALNVLGDGTHITAAANPNGV